MPGRRRFRHLVWLAATALSCGPPAVQSSPPDWNTASIELGQGQLQLGVRYRWVAERDSLGVVIRTPDGGEAQVRIFACGRPLGELLERVREKLSWRLVANDFARKGRVVGFRYWRGKAIGGVQASAALVLHGPLVVSVNSINLELSELVGIAERLRLVLPVAPLDGCVPLCDLEESSCGPAPDDEG